MPIPGTRQLHYLEENASAENIPLDEVEREELENAIGRPPLMGEQYTQEGMKGVVNL